ncbi:MAG: Alpha-glucosides-binding periplasmic protein AglE precursor [uncultured Acidimicrobiales bacterium]|uniref:Alpha-glucosides-binding periplasmic protein AglE n=1 Tax=uncultured Acidimicrobiales bacterium TaxID=310071 RepID=A0A6J4IR15_9ACTN|nr:MAG: Alpha-glucosides-binding periplasmic protein AglE precursor [uncultured Acidimicrobiales bacterium]
MDTNTGRRPRGRRLLAGLAALTLLTAAACTEDDSDDVASDAGTEGEGGAGGEGDGEVRISGPETGAEADGFQAALDVFSEESGVTAEYQGSRDFETQVRVAAEGGDLPDIGVIPQPGLVNDLESSITPVPQAIIDEHADSFDPTLFELVTNEGGDVLGVPNKGDVKSLVWYSPSVFQENGYEIPETFDDLMALADTMKADGITPWCIGIESGDATGWTLTDWMEDLMLRVHGPEVYDQWVNHEIPFNDPQVKEVAEMVEEIWFTEGNVLNGRQSIASTGFAAAGLPVLDGDCGMHRQANFYAANFSDANPDIEFGPEGDVDAFYLPTISDEFGQVTLVGGTYIVAFNDDPSTLEAMEFLTSAAYADARIEADFGGFISPNQDHDTSLYSSELDRTLAEILVEADPARFDGSDQMPSEVGSGSFWSEGTDWVLGTNSIDDFLDAVEASWPS